MRAITFIKVALALIIFCTCDTIDIADDPVLGVWTKTEIISSETQKEKVTKFQEWIFNDLYLGRYHIYENNELVFYHDFDWRINADETYTLSYRGEIELADEIFTLKKTTTEKLVKLDGSTFAIR